MAQQGYIELDTIAYAGVRLIEQGKRLNAISLNWQKSKNEVITLTSYEAWSYAINGTEYHAKDIEINGKEARFFLERMASGNLTLYFIQNKGKHFFIEKDSTLSELFKRDASGKKHCPLHLFWKNFLYVNIGERYEYLVIDLDEL